MGKLKNKNTVTKTIGGKTLLKDTVPDNEIVRKGEVRNEPNFIFACGNYGIVGQYMDYSLVEKKLSYRTGKKEDGEDEGKVIEYIDWKDVPAYHSTLKGMFESYAKIKNLTEFKTKKLVEDISEIIEINKNTQKLIVETLNNYDNVLSKNGTETLTLMDKKELLKDEIRELELRIKKYTKLDKEIDNMYKQIKDKTTIIVNRDKPKKHRIKEEE